MKNQKAVNGSSVFSELQKKFQYGAPELKTSYRKFVVRGLVIAVLVHAFVISGYLLSNMSGNNGSVGDIYVPKKIDIIDYEIPVKVPEIVQVEEVKKAPTIKDPGSLNVKPVKRVSVKEDIRIKSNKELEEVGDNVASVGDDKGTVENIIGSGPGKIDDVKIEENIKIKEPEPVKETYDLFEVDRQPVATNLNQIKGSLQYPESARIMGEEGKVTAKVLVDKNGRVKRILGMSGPSVFHDEVREKIRDLQFTPAIVKGEAVECRVTVPFSFVLKSR